MQGHHLAELNFGELRYDWDDPRIATFQNNLDLINGIAERSPGFNWRLTDEDMEAEQTAETGAFGGNPRMASTLSVWRDVDSLKHFVWNTLHKKFYEQRQDWFDPQTGGNMVLWWIEEGHKPTVAEGLARFAHFQKHGSTDHAFGWSHVANAA